MDPETARHAQNLAFVFGIVLITSFTGIVITWLKYRARRVVGSDVTTRLDQMAERMAKIDNAVDAIAVEVERVSEGQRFVTKVLAERGAGTGLPESRR